MNLTIVLTHNKSDQENINQINKVLSFVTKITDYHIDQNGNNFDTYHYELIGLENIKVTFFQLIPFGVKVSNDILYSLDSYKVFYGKGDEDKIGNHTRFFNHGMRFPVDSMGSDIIIHLINYENFSVEELKNKLENLGIKDMTSHEWGHITTSRLIKLIGEAPEHLPQELAIEEYKRKIIEGGLYHG